MPLCLEKNLENNGFIGIWHIQETEEVLLSYLDKETTAFDYLKTITHPHKRLEYLASRALIKQLLDEKKINYAGVIKDQFGKPFLQDSTYHISISHCQDYAAAIIHTHENIGIDIERMQEKVQKVGHKFLLPTELLQVAGQIPKLTLYWTMKEAVYKAVGQADIFLKDIQIQPLAENVYQAFVNNAKKTYIVHNFCVEDYIVSYCS